MKEFARSSVQENERQMFAPRSQAQCKPWSGFGVKPDLGPLRRRRGESLLRSLEAGLTIDVKVLPGRGEFKGLNEFILGNHAYSSRAFHPAGRFSNPSLSNTRPAPVFTVAGIAYWFTNPSWWNCRITRLLRAIVAEHRPMFMDFTFRIFLLR